MGRPWICRAMSASLSNLLCCHITRIPRSMMDAMKAQISIVQPPIDNNEIRRNTHFALVIDTYHIYARAKDPKLLRLWHHDSFFLNSPTAIHHPFLSYSLTISTPKLSKVAVQVVVAMAKCHLRLLISG